MTFYCVLTTKNKNLHEFLETLLHVYKFLEHD